MSETEKKLLEAMAGEGFGDRARGLQGVPGGPEELPGSAAEGSESLTDVLSGEQPIGEKEISEAMAILEKYKSAKASLDKRIIDNEEWYKLGHWKQYGNRVMEGKRAPSTGWLFNSIANKHADAMDNYPEPNVLPRAQDDEETARLLSDILPVVLEQADYESVYSDTWWRKLKQGTGVKGIFWDPALREGLGDIAIRSMDLLMLYWEPGVEDIQDSANFFSLALADNDRLAARWPQLEGKAGSSGITVGQYVSDQNIDTSEKSAVIDWYYHKNGKLHYCKFVEGVVLFATENQEEYEKGWYEDGRYPFEFDKLFSLKGSPCGFGYIDVAKSAQEYIDRGNQAILQNMLANARPRHFIRNDGSVKEEEYGDYTKPFVHVEGGLGTDSIMPIPQNPLPSAYQSIISEKVNELKEVTGNRDISTGGTTSGVTAASAIAAMQEAGSKLSRDSNKASYRAFRQVVLMIIERIRQFYTLPRCFRILGQDGQEKYTEYTNAHLTEQVDEQGNLRHPLFDVEVSAEKQSPYSKMSNNELALQFYSAGFFNPQLADQALACLDMMDFNRKSFIENKIRENGTMFQQLQVMQQTMMGMAAELDAIKGGNLTQQVAAQMGIVQPGTGGVASAQGQAVLGDEEGAKGESSTTKKARQRTADSTAPT